MKRKISNVLAIIGFFMVFWGVASADQAVIMGDYYPLDSVIRWGGIGLALMIQNSWRINE